METCIYLITFDDGCWIKAELTTIQPDALAQAKATYGDDIRYCVPVPATDAAAIKLSRTKLSPGYARYCEACDIVQTYRNNPYGLAHYDEWKRIMAKYAARVIGWNGLNPLPVGEA